MTMEKKWCGHTSFSVITPRAHRAFAKNHKHIDDDSVDEYNNFCVIPGNLEKDIDYKKIRENLEN